MDWNLIRERLQGCYVTLPTMFSDADLSVDPGAMREHVAFLLAGGIETGTGVLLAGGAAGDFTTMSFAERVGVCATAVEAADDRVPVAFGAQTTNTAELGEFARAAADLGATFIQVSAPFYFDHTEDDVLEYVESAASAADVGIILYNTFWTSSGVGPQLLERLGEIPNLVGLKWSTPDHGFMEFEEVVHATADRYSIIDNQLRFVTSHLLGARAIETHVCNYWPEWGVQLWDLLEKGDYAEVQRQLVSVAMPFMKLWRDMEAYTAGDGYADKLCMELVGLPSSRCRPPTRDVRSLYRDAAREMLLRTGAPRILGE